MIIAFYDNDFKMLMPGPICFNIDLMKLSSYYKNKQDIVFLINNFKNTGMYNKVIYNSNLIEPNFNIIPDSNEIEFRGMFFDGKYIPLPKEIESKVNDTSLYVNFMEKNPGAVSEETKRRNNFLIKNSCNIRLAPDGKKITNNFERDILPKKTFIIHDQDFFTLSDWKEVIKDLPKSRVSFSFKYQQELTSVSDFSYISSFGVSEFLSHYHITITDNEEYKDLFKEKYSKYCQVECFRRTSDNYGMMSVELQNLIKRIFFYRVNKGKFTLINTKKIFDKDLENFIDLLLRWAIATKDFNFFDYCESVKFLQEKAYKSKISTVIKRYNLKELLLISVEKMKEIQL